MCIGNFTEALIYVLTLGYGKPISTRVAKKLGYKSCGCEERRQWLNKLGKCNEAIDLTKI
jgi:hypothetical protein